MPIKTWMNPLRRRLNRLSVLVLGLIAVLIACAFAQSAASAKGIVLWSYGHNQIVLGFRVHAIGIFNYGNESGDAPGWWKERGWPQIANLQSPRYSKTFGFHLLAGHLLRQWDTRSGGIVSFEGWMLSYIPWIIAALILPTMTLFGILRKQVTSFLFRHRKPDGEFCPHCGYDLRMSIDRCPECGQLFDRKTIVVAKAASAS
jgi:hypothetical protein